MRTEATTSKTHRNLSIAALLFGLIGLLELGWVLMENMKPNPCGRPLTKDYFSISSLLGFALGLIAIAPISLAEAVQGAIWTGGKRLAILGLIASFPGLLIAIASLPSCSIYATCALRETGPSQILRGIYNSQAQYYAARSRYATLEELHESGFIDTALANGKPTYGYVYSSSDVTAET